MQLQYRLSQLTIQAYCLRPAVGAKKSDLWYCRSAGAEGRRLVAGLVPGRS